MKGMEQSNMIGIVLIMIAFAVGLGAIWNYYIAPTQKKEIRQDGKKGIKKSITQAYLPIIIIAVAAFIIRLIFGAIYKGHETDMGCFIGWSDAIYQNGIGKFYTLDMFHDYPPGYMYVLYVIGALKKLFGLHDGAALYMLVKMPAILCDIAGGLIIYKIAEKKLSTNVSTVIAALYMFNPATIVNSSLWGQVDSVYTVLILLMIYLITEKKLYISYAVFAACIFIKPQALIFTPVVLYAFVEEVFLGGFSKEKLLKHLASGAAAIVVMIIVALPFGFGEVVGQYKATLESYPYHTVNAFNLWGAIGKNWAGLTGISTILSYTFIVLIVLFSVCILYRSKDKSKYYFAGAILAFFTYMLSTKMHDRYAFPAMILLLAACATTLNPRKYVMYLLVTLSQFFNTAWVLFIYSKNANEYFQSPIIVVASIINIAIMIYIIYETNRLYIDNKIYHYEESQIESVKVISKNNKQKKNKNVKTQVKFSLSKVFDKLTRADIIAMVVITLVYSAVALYDLGDMHAPENDYVVSNGNVSIDLGKEYEVSKIKFFLGSYELGEDRSLIINAKNQNKQTTYQENIEEASVFAWKEEKVLNKKIRYINLSTRGKDLSVKEFAVIDKEGKAVTPISVTPNAANALFDEQQEIPERSTFRNGTYFDEIYHARTGYEFVHSLPVYEWTHPPLGKVFIALGIKLFGMNPFGWRIMGTLFGILMIPVIYIFARRLLKKTWLAVITCLLFTFDFMHFAQTRIATIDVYVTFFIMLMYYFMYKYYKTSFYDTSLKKGFIMLALCGTTMGLAIASKWTGIYAAFGLAAIFVVTMGRRFAEYRYALKNPKGTTDGISHKYIIDNFVPYFVKTICWCVIFFIIVPIIIYCASYIPYLQAPDSQGFKTIWENQESMLTYHADTVLGSTHPFSSKWYEWIIMRRPIWYYSGTISDGIKEGISSFGNPLVWWMGIPAFGYMLYLTIRKKSKTALFLVIAYVSQIFMWIPIERLTFIYHYFPSVPFVVLMIGYAIKTLYDNAKNKKRFMYMAFVYAGLVIVLFIMFYPVLSGQPCSTNYAKEFLKWFESWVLL